MFNKFCVEETFKVFTFATRIPFIVQRNNMFDEQVAMSPVKSLIAIAAIGAECLSLGPPPERYKI